MRTTEQYLALIPSFHAPRPNFIATVGMTVDPLARMQAALAQLEMAFDLDAAVGVQLDAVGVRVGRSREVPYPLQGLFFTLGDPVRGLGAGIWIGPYDTPLGVYRLDDETYRRLIRAKILANRWDGTIAGQQAILDAYFQDPDTLVFAVDDTYSVVAQGWFSLGDPLRGLGIGLLRPIGAAPGGTNAADMVMTVGIAGKLPSLQDLALLRDGLVAAKPAGVRLNYAVTSKQGAPLFGLGCQDAYVAGLGSGALAVTPDYALSHVIP